MLYNRDLAIQICHYLGIKWDPTATCATVAGEPVYSENLTPDDIVCVTPYDVSCQEENSSLKE